MARKISKEEWDFEVKRALKIRELNTEKMKRSKYAYFDLHVKKWMPLPIIIGVIAALLLFYFYGINEFFKFFLSWIVSMTIIATAAYYLWKHYEKKVRG